MKLNSGQIISELNEIQDFIEQNLWDFKKREKLLKVIEIFLRENIDKFIDKNTGFYFEENHDFEELKALNLIIKKLELLDELSKFNDDENQIQKIKFDYYKEVWEIKNEINKIFDNIILKNKIAKIDSEIEKAVNHIKEDIKKTVESREKKYFVLISGIITAVLTVISFINIGTKAEKNETLLILIGGAILVSLFIFSLIWISFFIIKKQKNDSKKIN